MPLASRKGSYSNLRSRKRFKLRLQRSQRPPAIAIAHTRKHVPRNRAFQTLGACGAKCKTAFGQDHLLLLHKTLLALAATRSQRGAARWSATKSGTLLGVRSNQEGTFRMTCCCVTIARLPLKSDRDWPRLRTAPGPSAGEKDNSGGHPNQSN